MRSKQETVDTDLALTVTRPSSSHEQATSRKLLVNFSSCLKSLIALESVASMITRISIDVYPLCSVFISLFILVTALCFGRDFRAENGDLGGLLLYHSRPVCVALSTEHRTEFLCGNKFDRVETGKGSEETFQSFWRCTVPLKEATVMLASPEPWIAFTRREAKGAIAITGSTLTIFTLGVTFTTTV